MNIAKKTSIFMFFLISSMHIPITCAMATDDIHDYKNVKKILIFTSNYNTIFDDSLFKTFQQYMDESNINYQLFINSNNYDSTSELEEDINNVIEKEKIWMPLFH